MAAPKPVAIRSDARRVVVDAGCQTVLYDLDSTRRLFAWSEQLSTIRFSGDGRSLLTVQHDQVRVWDAVRFHEVRRFVGRP